MEKLSSSLDDERRALIYALAAVCLWSTVATAFKLALQELLPLQLLLVATLVSGFVFWGAAFATTRYRMTGRELREAFVLGLLNPFAYYLVLFEAYDRLPAQIAQPINYTWAIMLAILAVPILGQRLSRRTLAGIVVSYVGVVILLTQGSLDALRTTSWSGVTLALFSTLLWASYWLLNTRSKAAPIGLMAWSFTFALPFIALACWLGPGFPRLGWRSAALGIYVGLVEMGVTYLLWQHSLRLTRHAARIGHLIFLSPFVSLALIGAILGEDIHASSLIGLAIIVGGVWLAQQRRAGAESRQGRPV